MNFNAVIIRHGSEFECIFVSVGRIARPTTLDRSEAKSANGGGMSGALVELNENTRTVRFVPRDNLHSTVFQATSNDVAECNCVFWRDLPMITHLESTIIGPKSTAVIDSAPVYGASTAVTVSSVF